MIEKNVQPPTLPIVPAAFFGMVLGLGGLGGVWRVAERVWGFPGLPGEVLLLCAAALWLVFATLFAAKWMWATQAARAEVDNPALAFGLGLIPMATLMASIATRPYFPGAAWCIFFCGLTGGVLLTAWLIGGLWQGGRGLETVTPLMVLPSVGTAYTGALAAGAFGYREVAALLWGPGLITWIIMDSLILFRLMSLCLPLPLRATIGVQLAPPSVGCLAYLGFTEGVPDRFVHVVIGYALLQGLILLRLAPWIRAQPFSAGAWAFTFGVAALAGSALLCLERHPTGAIAQLAWPLFVFANVFIGWIAARTLTLALTGRLFPIVSTQRAPA